MRLEFKNQEFQTDAVSNIFNEKELMKNSVVAKFATTWMRLRLLKKKQTGQTKQKKAEVYVR